MTKIQTMPNILILGQINRVINEFTCSVKESGNIEILHCVLYYSNQTYFMATKATFASTKKTQNMNTKRRYLYEIIWNFPIQWFADSRSSNFKESDYIRLQHGDGMPSQEGKELRWRLFNVCSFVLLQWIKITELELKQICSIEGVNL